MKAKGWVIRNWRRMLQKCIYIPLPDLNSRKERIKINLRTMEVYMMQKKLAAKDYEINRLKQLLVQKKGMNFKERDEPGEDEKDYENRKWWNWSLKKRINKYEEVPRDTKSTRKRPSQDGKLQQQSGVGDRYLIRSTFCWRRRYL